MRKLGIGLSTLLALVLATALGLVAYQRSAAPPLDGQRHVPGLGANVEISRDSLGVPHIRASSIEDLFFAVGFVHAQDRLWQMELFRRVAEGRLAEILGEDLVQSDRFLRTIGLWRAAAATEAILGEDELGPLDSYASGVNAWLRYRRGALPPEFTVLRIQPEPWTVRHTLAIEKIMAWDLAGYDTGLNLATAVRRVGEDRAAHLVAEYPDWAPTILGGPLPPRIPAPAARLLDALSASRASNAWVIAGDRTVSGKPILANDMHLELRVPGIWYLAALHGGGLDVAGMTLPGVPFVVAGRNRAIAWGFTNANVDDIDFFVERIDPDDPSRYLVPDGSQPFQVVVETIRVRGRDDPVVDTLRLTRHGPVLTPVERRTGQDLIAMRWVGHDPGRTWRALLGFNRASSWPDFVEAIADFDNPHQNVVYADTAGNIGYYMGGTVPIRKDGRRPPLLPVPGWTGEWDWTGELPIEEHPHVLNPPEGYVVTANNRQVTGRIGDLIGNSWEEPFRAMRIREMIEAVPPGRPLLDADAVHRQQLDVRDLMAARYRDRAVEAALRAGLPGTAAVLGSWDLDARADSPAAALFYVWYDRLADLAARSLYGVGEYDPVGRPGWFPRDALHRVLELRAIPWIDDARGDRYQGLSARAMTEADSIVGSRTWGELNRVTLEHAMGEVDLLERSLRLNVGPAPIGGSHHTVNVAHRQGDGWPARVRYGASQRHVADMGDLDAAGGFILPAGQSGLPFHRRYRDQFGRWLNGGLWPIPLDPDRSRAAAVQTYILRPETIR